MKAYRFGNNEVVTAAGSMAGQPILCIAHAADFPAGKPTAEELTAHPETVILQLANAEGAIFVATQLFSAIEHTAAKLGVDVNDLKFPVVPTMVHEAMLAEHDRRVQDLLEANNRYLERARNAEMALAVLQQGQPVQVAP